MLRVSSIKPHLRFLRNKFRWAWKNISYRSLEIKEANDLSHLVTEVTYLFPGGASSEKIHNIQIAIKNLNEIAIKSGDRFSFWKTVKAPTASRGYIRSRSIVNGEIKQEIGGGLCQLSGMLFHLALLSGLKVVERHSHSLDIYQEHERHSPLGLDAAIVFPSKDLILKNESSEEFRFIIEVDKTFITGRTFSNKSITQRSIEVMRVDGINDRRCHTTVTALGGIEVEFVSSYRLPS